MSMVKCVGAVALAGGAIAGGVALGKGLVRRKQIIRSAENIASRNGGKIPTGGMTKDGALWDGYTTVADEKKKVNKTVALMTGASALAGTLISAGCAALTLLMKAKFFK